MKLIFTVLAMLFLSTVAMADSDFCNGFEMGYKTVKGNMTLVPLCPLEPLTPLGSTPFQEGIKAGMNAAYGQ